MAIFIQKIPTYETNLWDGSNTEAFKVWTLPFLQPVPEGFTRVWSVIDNTLDPENTITDGILRASVPGQGYGIFTNDFLLDEIAIAGPLYGGVPTPYAGSGISSQPIAYVATLFDEVV